MNLYLSPTNALASAPSNALLRMNECFLMSFLLHRYLYFPQWFQFSSIPYCVDSSAFCSNIVQFVYIISIYMHIHMVYHIDLLGHK